jgi:hypothetical protein
MRPRSKAPTHNINARAGHTEKALAGGVWSNHNVGAHIDAPAHNINAPAGHTERARGGAQRNPGYTVQTNIAP